LRVEREREREERAGGEKKENDRGRRVDLCG